MTPKRTSANSPAAPAMNVVIVTMDSHLASAAERANAVLARSLPGLRLTVHAAAEWGDHPQALARCKADIASAHIVIASMLFLEDHFMPVLADLQARRDRCDAMVCAMSAGEVTRLTRMGGFDMSAPATGALAFLKRLRGKPPGPDAQGRPGGSAGAQQMKTLRMLPKILRFIPGTAQDVRAYFLTCLLYTSPSPRD